MSAHCETARVAAFTRARNAEIEASIAAVEKERARAFAAARNAEINASIAAVRTARAQLALSKTHCKTADSTTPRCLTERERKLALARTHCKSPDSTTPRCLTEQARGFAAARNAEINASIARVNAERTRAFAAARNAEINASIAAVEKERTRAFAAARNAEIEASLARVADRRAFEMARNAEINASIARVNAERAREFAAARNVEINASIAAYRAQRALQRAMALRSEMRTAAAEVRMETGAINIPETLGPKGPAQAAQQARHTTPCRGSALLMRPMHFSQGGTELDETMKPTLRQIAMIARDCPAIRIEIHGHSDASGPAQVNRHLSHRRAQAARDFLIDAGVDADRLAAIGHGGAVPLMPNTTDENRAMNRRIEVEIKDPVMEAAARRIMWDLAELLDPTYVPAVALLSP